VNFVRGENKYENKLCADRRFFELQKARRSLFSQVPRHLMKPAELSWKNSNSHMNTDFVFAYSRNSVKILHNLLFCVNISGVFKQVKLGTCSLVSLNIAVRKRKFCADDEKVNVFHIYLPLLLRS
jgi:hypothetical protein